jgi:ABC-2 type transport system ATP-binding protein
MSQHRNPVPVPSIPPAGTLLAALRGVHKHYGEVQALTGVDLDVRSGEVLAVLGSNGAGKSTALGLLTGRISADGGQVELLGGDPREPSIRRGIGVMLQEGRLPETLRVAEHIALFSSYYPNPRPVEETLALAGLGDLRSRRYDALSGGQQRRVQFAVAICGRPALLFVDEPTVGLDVKARRNFWSVLRQLRIEGTGIVLTTHYLEEADALADRVVLLANGRVLAEDTPAGIKARASGKRVRGRSSLPLDLLRGWPEVRSATVADGVTELQSHDAEALLRRWLQADPKLADLEVRALNLEEAFLSLTAPVAATSVEEEMA